MSLRTMFKGSQCVDYAISRPAILQQKRLFKVIDLCSETGRLPVKAITINSPNFVDTSFCVFAAKLSVFAANTLIFIGFAALEADSAAISVSLVSIRNLVLISAWLRRLYFEEAIILRKIGVFVDDGRCLKLRRRLPCKRSTHECCQQAGKRHWVRGLKLICSPCVEQAIPRTKTQNTLLKGSGSQAKILSSQPAITD